MNTSYFSKLNRISYPISISRFPPFYYKGEEYLTLAPSAELLTKYKNQLITEEEYALEFNKYLNILNVEKVYIDLFNIFTLDDFTLLCYEKPKEFCHRHLVADWFKKHGYTIEELSW